MLILNLCLLVIATASTVDGVDAKGAEVSRAFREAWVKLDPVGYGCLRIGQVGALRPWRGWSPQRPTPLCAQLDELLLALHDIVGLPRRPFR